LYEYKDYGIPNRPLGGLQGQPSGTNLAVPQNFLFKLGRFPNISYFVQEVQLPDKGTPPKEYAGMIGPNLKQPSAAPSYSTLSLVFLVDENLENYYNIVTWMREGSAYSDFSNVKPLKDIYDTAYLMFLSNKKVPFRKITFEDIIPTEISGLEFTYSDTEYRPIVATCKFTITQFSVEEL
jgi:hypothetical protein